MYYFKHIGLLFIFCFLLLCSSKTLAQRISSSAAKKDSIPSLETSMGEEEEEEIEPSKKKIKKKVFYGIKTKKAFTRTGKGKRQTIELFYFLKKNQEPNAYIRSIHIYDLKKRKILEVSTLEDLDKNTYRILHGPYKKIVGGINGQVMEEGIFFIGMRHGRWEKYGKDFVLMDKTKYYKGLLKDSKVSYYDPAKTKIKEVVPYKFNDLHGEYYTFKENGEVLIYGKYIDGKKAGIWIEYFNDKNKRKKEIQYPRNPYVEQFEPFVISEWDEKGNVLIRNGQPFDPKKAMKGRK
jgi:antitoxin component YwqK of YwqJK toxin-antitoxin module